MNNVTDRAKHEPKKTRRSPSQGRIAGKSKKKKRGVAAARGGSAASHRGRREVASTKPKQARSVAPPPSVKDLPDRDEIRQRHGEPVYARSKFSINSGYWAALYNQKHRTAYIVEEQNFYDYDEGTGLWQAITPEAIRERLSAMLFKAAQQDDDLSELEGLRCVSTLNGIIDRLKGMCEERQTVFDPRAPQVHVANGVIRLDGSKPVFTGFSPDHRSRHQLPFSYDPKAKCRRFLDELLGPAVSKEGIELLQMYAGAAIDGRNRAQRLLILEGVAGAGKSTFVAVIQAIIGQCNCGQLRTHHLTGRFETHRFLGKKLLLGSDVSADFLAAGGAHMIKSLVGDDLFDAEAKNSNRSFPIRGEFNIIVTANERLRVRLQGDADAWRRRLLIVRFNTPPEVKVPNFADLLIWEEAAGILNWMLGGHGKLAEALAKTGDFPLTKAQHDRIDALLDESDSVRVFINQGVVRDVKADVTTSELVEAYLKFCADKGWASLPARSVQQELVRLMAEIHHVHLSHSIKRSGIGEQRGYRGVRL